MNKKRDDKFINKNEPHEIRYILSLYDEDDHATIRHVLETCKDYITHDEFYELLEDEYIQAIKIQAGLVPAFLYLKLYHSKS